MPLLNYTTAVSVDKSISEIHRLLVRAGARQIATEYDTNEQPTAVGFLVDTAHGPRRFVLPVAADRVQAILHKQKLAPRYTSAAHANRVAWRIIKDWLEAQLALISTEMVTVDQIMLPYMRLDDGQTVYELYLQQQLALPPADR